MNAPICFENVYMTRRDLTVSALVPSFNRFWPQPDELLSMKVSPVVIFAYNRPEHLRQTLVALSANELVEKTPVYIYIDGARSDRDHEAVKEVRELVDGWKRLNIVECVQAERNCGLSASVIAGVSAVLAEYDSAIVLEDDLVTSPYFLRYMNTALNKFSSVEQVMSVSGYGRPGVRNGLQARDPYDAYFVPRNSSWGWGTWDRSWALSDWEMTDYEEFRSDKSQRKRFSCAGSEVELMLHLQQRGLIDSWAIRWTYAHFKNNGLSLVPYESYVRNIGFDNSGTHCRRNRRNKRLVDLNLEFARSVPNLPDTPEVRRDVLETFRKLHRQGLVSQAYWNLRLFAERFK